jgi:hypothetical protein
MTSGLVPSEVLDVLVSEAAVQFDTTVAWFPATGEDVHGEHTYATTPVLVPARVVKKMDQFYNVQGQQMVPTQRIYLPLGTAVGMHDKLLPVGADPKVWPPILEIAEIPTTGEPVMLRVRTGQA